MIQAAFAAGCALSVFFYVWANIDEIKAKQAENIARTVEKQTMDIKSAQDGQKRAIAEAQRKQQADIEKLKRNQPPLNPPQ